MTDLLRLLALRRLRSEPLRSALTLLGAACGVALFVAIEIINGATLAYFRDGVRAMAGGAQLTVSAGEAGFAQSLRERLLQVTGVREAVPSVEAVAYLLPSGNAEPQALAVLGVDPILEPLVRTHRLRGSAAEPGSLRALLVADAILLPEDPDAQRGMGSVELLAQEGRARLSVAGRLDPFPAGGGSAALLELGTAQRVFGFSSRVTRLDLLLQEGCDADALAVQLRALLGPSFQVQGSRAREADMQRMVRGYQTLLRFVSVVTLAAGALALGATLALSVREREPSIGVLRALGATRATVFLWVLAEAALLSALAVALGLAAGRLGAEALVGAVSRTMAHTYMLPIRPSALSYPGELALRHALFAWLVGVAAALVAALRAARLDPVQAIRGGEAGSETRSPRWLSLLGALGGALAALLAAVVATGADRAAPLWQSANAALGLAAALMLAPWAALAGLGRLQRSAPGQWLVERFVTLRLALGNVLRAPVRSAWNVLLLSLGLLMFVTADTLHHSLLAGVDAWMERTLYSDLLVATPGRLFMMEVQPLDETLAQDIDAVPGVQVLQGRGAMGVRYVNLRYREREVTLKAFDRPHAGLPGLPFDLRGDHKLERGGDIFDSKVPAALVSENFVRHFGLQTGDTLTLDSPEGALPLRILGIVTDFASPEGVIYLARDLYKSRWHDPLVSVFSVRVRPGFAPERVAQALETSLASRGLRATNSRELRRQSREILNESFAYTYAIQGAALLAAVLGIVNSTIGSVLARRRELALLRALGMSARQLRQMLVCEGLCLAAAAALLAALFGSALGYLCLAGVLSALMGWTLELQLSPWTPCITLALGALSGAVASALAAAKAARLSLVDALAMS